VKEHHANPDGNYDAQLNDLADRFENLTAKASRAALIYSYLGSVRTLQKQSDAAIAAYTRAVALDPNDKFTAGALKAQQAAKALQPKVVEGAPATTVLDGIRNQKLAGYDPGALLPAQRQITVAVLSTGISPELSAVLGNRLVNRASTVPDETDIDDRNGHGTKVAALVAALAPSAKVMPIKSLSKSGSGSEEVIAQGIKTAVTRRADIILLPLGARTGSNKIEDAVKEALNAGLLVIAAAGNDGDEQPSSPARVSGVVAAGALDASGKVASFSNRGPGVLYAPGVNIVTLGENGKLVTISGTSFSSTLAAAFAANVWAAKGNLSEQQMRDLLFKTSVNLGPVDPGKP